MPRGFPQLEVAWSIMATHQRAPSPVAAPSSRPMDQVALYKALADAAELGHTTTSRQEADPSPSHARTHVGSGQVAHSELDASISPATPFACSGCCRHKGCTGNVCNSGVSAEAKASSRASRRLWSSSNRPIKRERPPLPDRKSRCANRPRPVNQPLFAQGLPSSPAPSQQEYGYHEVLHDSHVTCLLGVRLAPGAMRRCSEGQDRPHAFGQPIRAIWSWYIPSATRCTSGLV